MPRRNTRRGYREPKHRTGIRNRTRTGRGTYSRKNKGRRAEFYGKWVNGTRTD